MCICMCVLQQQNRALSGVRGEWFLGLHVPFFFFSLDLSNIEKGRGLPVSFGSPVSKTNSGSGLVNLLGEVLDVCDVSSDFCDNAPWDVAAELSRWGFMFCKRPSSGFWRDGGKMFSFCMF